MVSLNVSNSSIRDFSRLPVTNSVSVTCGKNSFGLQLTVGSLRNAILEFLPTCGVLYQGDICTTSLFRLVAVASIANVSVEIIESTNRNGRKRHYELGYGPCQSRNIRLKPFGLMAREQVAASAAQPFGVSQPDGGRADCSLSWATTGRIS